MPLPQHNSPRSGFAHAGGVMRFFWFALVLGLASLGAAQDTTFSTGPEYLITFGSPMFARSIATPSLSWDDATPATTTTSATTEPTSSELFESVSSSLDAQRQTALLSIYYGTPATTGSEIPASSEESNRPVAAVPVEVGISSITDAQALRAQGYGVTPGEAATARGASAHRSHRVYTNQDVEHLRPAN
jgi:hypothetical protein